MFRYFVNIFFVSFLSFQFAAGKEPQPSATVYIPMRDGMELPADLYYPPGSIISSDYPCVLLRLPAGRSAQPWKQLAEISQHGYVVAIQDTRSSLDKEGKTMPYLSDAWGHTHQDGFDTVEWLSKSSFTNGKIGTIGFSAAGITQIMLAPTAPAALKCQYIGQAASSLYHHAIYPGGKFHKHQVESWLGSYAPHPSVMELVKSHPHYNDFWKRVDALSVADKVDTPAIHYTGWFDTFLQGTIDSFVSRQERGKAGAMGKQKLLIGPWNHFWPVDFSLGDFQVQENARDVPLDFSAKRWFDYYLKGENNGIAELPAVAYYVMGPFDGSPSSGNRWRYTDQWPVPATETAWYLTSEGAIKEKMELKNGVFAFENHPDNPVPTIGGRNLFLEHGPKDQRPLEARKDVILFTSSPLQEDLEVTGKIHVKLFLTSTVPDGDISVRLTDVYPDGKSILITDGMSRTSSLDVLLNEKQPKEILIDLASTSIVFAKGHALRLIISGSNYPRYDTSDHARNALHVGENMPSRLLLPIVRRGLQ